MMLLRLSPMMILFLSLSSCFYMPRAVAALHSSIPVSLSLETVHDVTARMIGKGVVEIQTTGPDPYLYTMPLPAGTDVAQRPILAFEYFSLTGTDEMQIFMVPPGREATSVKSAGLSRSEGWSGYRQDLTAALAETTNGVKRLRIDFGRKVGCTVRIRKVVMRQLNEQERLLAERQAAHSARAAASDAALHSYLEAVYSLSISEVRVDDTTITVSGEMGDGTGSYWLLELPIFLDLQDISSAISHGRIRSDTQGHFTHEVPRYGDNGQDRLLSRWAVGQKTEKGFTLRSHGRYADAVISRPGLTEVRPRGRKGLGGFSPGRPLEDIDALHISAVTVNLQLGSFLRCTPAEGRRSYEYGGRTWYVDDDTVARMDDTMLRAAHYNQVVSAILLIAQAGNAPTGDFRRMIAHPDADPAGIYVMPNLTSAEGVAAYGAALNFLAERYSRPDGEFGRIHHWLMHNEVNSGWVWTNMGEATALRYMDAYHKSMRMMQLIARQYDPFSRVFISLDQHWTASYNPHCFSGKELLEILLAFSQAEGDFPWSIALHPYPEDLRNPRAWENTKAWYSFDTPRITFKNIEVIDAWVKRPETRYQGKMVRDVQFTEQGPNSPDYSERSLAEQAACMAYLWKKMEVLESVSMFHFHNWVDHRQEGGLRIGLRRFRDDEEKPLGKKPVWDVFRACETPEQEQAFEFAKKIIGIGDWNEVIYRDVIGETKPE